MGEIADFVCEYGLEALMDPGRLVGEGSGGGSGGRKTKKNRRRGKGKKKKGGANKSVKK